MFIIISFTMIKHAITIYSWDPVNLVVVTTITKKVNKFRSVNYRRFTNQTESVTTGTTRISERGKKVDSDVAPEGVFVGLAVSCVSKVQPRNPQFARSASLVPSNGSTGTGKSKTALRSSTKVIAAQASFFVKEPFVSALVVKLAPQK